MSEALSLYRRHRPQSFDQVVGQEHVVRTLRNAIEQDKVHHAYLFVGSRGTGKTSMAKILARSLNCVNGPTASPCGECESCRTIAASTSLDVIEMDAASNRSVDDIRELRERVGYAPTGGGWKVYILDEAHMLTKEAWNAFLKTLEEPPPNTVFVLATTEAHKVMPTIVDRCQRFDFHRPSLEQIAAVLGRVAVAEQIDIDDAAVGMIARSATGSFRDALGTLDQLVAYGGKRVELDDVLAVLGVADAELIFETVDAIAGEDPRGALEAVERLARSGRDIPQFARDLVAHLRQLLVIRTMGEVPDGFSVTAAQSERLRAQSAGLADATLVRAIDELAAALSAIREGDEARVTLEVALLKAARSDLDPSQQALLSRIERLEEKDASNRQQEPSAKPQATGTKPQATSPKPQATGNKPQATGDKHQATGDKHQAGEPAPLPAGEGEASEPAEPLDLEKIKRLWPAVVDQVRQSGSVVLSALFENTRPVDVDSEESVLHVGFPASAPFNKKKAEAQPNRERFADAVRQIIGQSLRPVYVLLEGDGDSAEAKPAPELSEDELIEKLKTAFDAREDDAAEAGGPGDGEEPETRQKAAE